MSGWYRNVTRTPIVRTTPKESINISPGEVVYGPLVGASEGPQWERVDLDAEISQFSTIVLSRRTMLGDAIVALVAAQTIAAEYGKKCIFQTSDQYVDFLRSTNPTGVHVDAFGTSFGYIPSDMIAISFEGVFETDATINVGKSRLDLALSAFGLVSAPPEKGGK